MKKSARSDKAERKAAGIKDCTNCGFCKRQCPIFRVMLIETSGARGRARLAQMEINDEVFYLCTLCGACKVACPIGIDLPEEIKKVRGKLVLAGIETEANKKMIENIRKYGNPYGKVEKGKPPKELYCC
jgi:Fe-S oxidoreductase